MQSVGHIKLILLHFYNNQLDTKYVAIKVEMFLLQSVLGCPRKADITAINFSLWELMMTVQYMLISVIKHFTATIAALNTATHSSGKETLESHAPLNIFILFIYSSAAKVEYNFILYADWKFHTVGIWSGFTVLT